MMIASDAPQSSRFSCQSCVTSSVKKGASGCAGHRCSSMRETMYPKRNDPTDSPSSSRGIPIVGYVTYVIWKLSDTTINAQFARKITTGLQKNGTSARGLNSPWTSLCLANFSVSDGQSAEDGIAASACWLVLNPVGSSRSFIAS